MNEVGSSKQGRGAEDAVDASGARKTEASLRSGEYRYVGGTVKTSIHEQYGWDLD